MVKMSILLGLVERLREHADLCTERQLAIDLRDAADAICQLRDMLVGAKDESKRLRELACDAVRGRYDKNLYMSMSEWKEYDADVLRRARELGIEV